MFTSVFGSAYLSPPVPNAVATVQVTGVTPSSFDVCLINWLTPIIGIKIYPGGLPQGKNLLPAIVYDVVDADMDLNLGGPSGSAWRRIQLAIYSKNAMDCYLYSEYLRQQLAGYTGMMGTMFVQNSNRTRQMSRYDAPADNTGAGTFGMINEFKIHYIEPVG